MIEGELYWKPLTEKGEALKKQLQNFLTMHEAMCRRRETVIRAIVEKLYSNLFWKDGDRKITWTVLTLLYGKNFTNHVWHVVPVHSYALPASAMISKIMTQDTAYSVTVKDSCMYSDFTMMAHGNNRNSQMQRFRQRFMHKLVYYPVNNNGMFSCVGCGRCVEKCPSSLNIVKVIKAFENQGGEK